MMDIYRDPCTFFWHMTQTDYAYRSYHWFQVKIRWLLTDIVIREITNNVETFKTF